MNLGITRAEKRVARELQLRDKAGTRAVFPWSGNAPEAVEWLDPATGGLTDWVLDGFDLLTGIAWYRQGRG